MCARQMRGLRKNAAVSVVPMPLLFVLMLGLIQGGVLFLANAGLKSGVGEAARFATLWPRRTDTEITETLRSRAFGIDQSRLAAPVITRGFSQGAEYVEVSVVYSVPMDLYLNVLPPVRLTESRRAYIP